MIGKITDLLKNYNIKKRAGDMSTADQLRLIITAKRKRKNLVKEAQGNTAFYPLFVSSSLELSTLRDLPKVMEEFVASLIADIMSKNFLDISSSKGLNDALQGIVGDSYLQYKELLDNPTDMDSEFNELIDSLGLESVEEAQLFNNLILAHITNEKYVQVDLKLNDKSLALSSEKAGKPIDLTFNRKEKISKVVDPDTGDRKAVVNWSVDAKVIDNSKTLNKLKPTKKVVEVTFVSKEGLTITKEIVISVKCPVRPVNISEIISGITENSVSGKMLTRFIAWTQGEGKFFKDVLLNATKLKKLAKTMSKGSKSDENIIALMNMQVSDITKDGAFNPISTLVISKNDLMDLEKAVVAKIEQAKLQKILFGDIGFFSIAVIDEITNEMTLFLSGGEREVISLDDDSKSGKDGEVIKQLVAGLTKTR